MRRAALLLLLLPLVTGCPADDDDAVPDDDDLFQDDDDSVGDDDTAGDDDSAPDDDDSAPLDDDASVADDASAPDDDASGGDDDASAPAWDFQRFLLTSSAGPCPPEADCDGWIELLPDATLRVEKFGELPEVVHEATITAVEFDATVPLLVDPALIALLDLPEPPCVPPTDIFEQMRLEQQAGVHENSTTACSDEPLVAVRAALFALADSYFP